ncbi:hypothetical protein C7T35_21760 [Variovorax sp. WS11]|uniref:hypothetical protein n=1 Tax=Variovorax sp. WS11 TaxID=1105204 RepID=UPI000D0DAC3E|nr:hypothetical protein [Variovorax sp. WS11]PSL82458.1 hypothetical protein C7T35_21760 [Variovorax sp. WS11]
MHHVPGLNFDLSELWLRGMTVSEDYGDSSLGYSARPRCARSVPARTRSVSILNMREHFRKPM